MDHAATLQRCYNDLSGWLNRGLGTSLFAWKDEQQAQGVSDWIQEQALHQGLVRTMNIRKSMARRGGMSRLQHQASLVVVQSLLEAGAPTDRRTGTFEGSNGDSYTVWGGATLHLDVPVLKTLKMGNHRGLVPDDGGKGPSCWHALLRTLRFSSRTDRLEQDSLATAEALLEAGLEPMLGQEAYGQPVLHDLWSYAFQSSKGPEKIRIKNWVDLWLKHGADLSVADSSGQTLLHKAAHKRRLDVAQRIWQDPRAEAWMNVENQHGHTVWDRSDHVWLQAWSNLQARSLRTVALAERDDSEPTLNAQRGRARL